MSKATVKAIQFGPAAETASGWEYSAHHRDCGWFENRVYWHNAFWAADHHVRYDCGRREPSSGSFVSGEVPTSITEVPSSGSLREQAKSGSLTREFDQDGRLAAVPLPGESTGGSAHRGIGGQGEQDRWLNEGGVQNDPTPSDNGDPLPPECAEDAAVEQRCITTDLGIQVDGDSYTRGGAQAGVIPGWWAGLWGMGRGR